MQAANKRENGNFFSVLYGISKSDRERRGSRESSKISFRISLDDTLQTQRGNRTMGSFKKSI